MLNAYKKINMHGIVNVWICMHEKVIWEIIKTWCSSLLRMNMWNRGKGHMGHSGIEARALQLWCWGWPWISRQGSMCCSSIDVWALQLWCWIRVRGHPKRRAFIKSWFSLRFHSHEIKKKWKDPIKQRKVHLMIYSIFCIFISITCTLYLL